MKQSILILGATVLGLIFPQGHHLTFLIEYALMLMLLFAFLEIKFQRNIFTQSHLIIAAANLMLPLIFYLLLLPFGQTWALIAFICGIAPTAAAAPVLANFMHSDVSYVAAAVIITHLVVALSIPVLLPLLMPVEQPISLWEVLIPVLKVVGVPLIITGLIKSIKPSVASNLLRFKILSFYLFLLNVWIACAEATYFLENDGREHLQSLLPILGLTTVICFMLFKVGEYLGPGNDRLAGSLALGRKNTMFGLWLALTFIGPLVALGPICYIIVQNAYNSYQILMVEKQRRAIRL